MHTCEPRVLGHLEVEEPIPIHDESDVIPGRHLSVPFIDREAEGHRPTVKGDNLRRRRDNSADERRCEMIDGDPGSNRGHTLIEGAGERRNGRLLHESHNAWRAQNGYVPTPQGDCGVIITDDEANGCAGADFDLHMRQTVPGPRGTGSTRGWRGG